MTKSKNLETLRLKDFKIVRKPRKVIKCEFEFREKIVVNIIFRMLQWLSSILALYWPIFRIVYFYLLLGSELGLQFIAYAVGLLPSKLIKHLIDKNNSEFWKNFGIGVGLLGNGS